jgi:glycosyltransferase involved in cell wall biosynthesis
MKNQAPFFSIVIPTFNRVSSIGKAIESILNQSFNSLEIIIVDDGSTDNTNEVITSFNEDRIRYFKIENSERGAARNHGLQHAVGKYVNFFDSDDLFLPCFENLQTFIVKNNPHVVYGGIEHVDNAGNKVKESRLPYTSFTKNLFHNNFLACGSVFLKREIALQFPFHEDRRLSSAEDWELWLRIHAQYTFICFQGLIFQQVEHSDRSLTRISDEKIEIRDNYFADLVLENENLNRQFGILTLNSFAADRFTFIALVWFARDRSKSFSYWIKALKTSKLVLKRKRFWGILKKLILE